MNEAQMELLKAIVSSLEAIKDSIKTVIELDTK